jgi:transcriptional regulator with XRE-family HTH domain
MRASGDLAIALTLLRVVRGWTQDDLARAAGTANSSISEYERGKKVPELTTLQRRLVGPPLC